MVAKLKTFFAWVVKTARNWRKWLPGLLVALGAAFFGAKAYQSNRLRSKAQKAHSEAHSLSTEAAVEAERQRQRIREAEANAVRAEKASERLEKLKRKRNVLPLVLIPVLVACLALGPAKAADSPALPSDYAGLAKLYFATLDTVTALRGDLEEAISVAEEFKACYETEKRLREEAEAAVTRGLEREKQLQAIIDQQAEVIEKQHAIIQQLSRGGLIAGVLGALAGALGVGLAK